MVVVEAKGRAGKIVAETKGSPTQEMARWQAESDARSLTEAKAITLDADRFKAAEKAAKRLAKEEAERAKSQKDSSKAMNDLSKGSLNYSGMNKRNKKLN